MPLITKQRRKSCSLLGVVLLTAAMLMLPVTRTQAWEYVVQEGDTVSSVSALVQCSVAAIYAANPGHAVSLTKGEKLAIPDFVSSSSVLEVPYEEDLTLPVSDMPVIAYTADELDLLARCIHAEAGGESYEGQIAVGAVVVNRVLNPRFPDNIHDVIYAKKQFECVDNGMIKKAADESCRKAALAALYGADNTYGALYFWAPSLVYSKYHESLRYICAIGCHIFASDED